MPDLSQPNHLPNRRPDRQPPDKSWLPRQRRGTTPQMVGRYPDYDVFDAASGWDAATRQGRRAAYDQAVAAHSVLRRRRKADRLRAFCDIVTAQDAEPRVPVVEMVDKKLAPGPMTATSTPTCPTIARRGASCSTASTRRRGSATPRDFAAWTTGAGGRDRASSPQGALRGGAWDLLNVKRAFSVCMRAVLAEFYSHPWAWNEIGFGGPAYPRGYMRLGPLSVREPFEKRGATAEDPVGFAAEER